MESGIADTASGANLIVGDISRGRTEQRKFVENLKIDCSIQHIFDIGKSLKFLYRLLERVMKIQEAIWAHYSDVGNTALKASQLSLAETMFMAAAEEAQRGVPDSLRLAHSWFGLAQTHHSQNQSVLAAYYYKKALPVYEKSAKGFATHLAATWDNLAEIHISQGDFLRANYFYKKSVKMYEKLFGKESSVLAPRLLRLGYISLQFKEFDEALAYRDRARAVSANYQSPSK